jgi:hypothetical protein
VSSAVCVSLKNSGQVSRTSTLSLGSSDWLLNVMNPSTFPNSRVSLSHIYFTMFALRRSSTIPISKFWSYNSFRMASTKPAATIKSLDHLVLTVRSIPASTSWYENNLGMRSESFVSAATPSITRNSLIFGSQKINLHELGKVNPPLYCGYTSHS